MWHESFHNGLLMRTAFLVPINPDLGDLCRYHHLTPLSFLDQSYQIWVFINLISNV